MYQSDHNEIGIGQRLIWFFTCVYLMSTYLLSAVTWGKYLLLAMLALVFVIFLYLRDGHMALCLEEFHVFMLVFLICSLCTAIWANVPADTLSRCKSLLEIMLCTALLYVVYDEDGSILPLLRILMWCGVMGAFFLFAYFGPSSIFSLLNDSTRLEGQIWNSNTIARMMGTSLMILAYFILFHGWKWHYLLFAFPVVLVVVTQSRTVIIGDTVGVLLLVFMSRQRKKNEARMRPRAFLTVLLIVAIVAAAFEAGLLDGTMERFDGLVSALSGKGDADSSAEKRLEMIRIGLVQFQRTPLFGIGLDNAHYLAKARFGLDYYLHNNYVELLVGCGLIGTLSYYAIYIYLLHGFYKFRYCRDICLPACIALLITQLMIDMGSVSYYKKDMYFVFLICFLEYKQLGLNAAKTMGEEYGNEVG